MLGPIEAPPKISCTGEEEDMVGDVDCGECGLFVLLRWTGSVEIVSASVEFALMER